MFITFFYSHTLKIWYCSLYNVHLSSLKNTYLKKQIIFPKLIINKNFYHAHTVRPLDDASQDNAQGLTSKGPYTHRWDELMVHLMKYTTDPAMMIAIAHRIRIQKRLPVFDLGDKHQMDDHA